MRLAIWIGLSVIVMMVSILVIDAIGRMLVLKDKTELTLVESTTSTSRRLIVYFPGILADAKMSSRALLPVWLQYGDVLLVDYRGTRFKADDVADDVVKMVHHRAADYDEVVFIGSSMGGLLSYDTAVRLNQPWTPRLKFVLVDAPTKRSDLQHPLDKASLLATFTGGPITNLFSKLYFDATFVEPKEENIEDGVDRDELAAYIERAKSFPLSTNNDWVRYIIGHESLGAGALYGFESVYVRSSRDHDTVRPRAYEAWKHAFGGHLRRIEVDSTHVGYVERPATWQAAFREAFGLIGVEK